MKSNGWKWLARVHEAHGIIGSETLTFLPSATAAILGKPIEGLLAPQLALRLGKSLLRVRFRNGDGATQYGGVPPGGFLESIPGR